MCYGSHHDAGDANEENSRKERIQTRECLAIGCLQHVYWYHDAEIHGDTAECINPGELFKPGVPADKATPHPESSVTQRCAAS